MRLLVPAFERTLLFLHPQTRRLGLRARERLKELCFFALLLRRLTSPVDAKAHKRQIKAAPSLPVISKQVCDFAEAQVERPPEGTLPSAPPSADFATIDLLPVS